ncbi:hypothetical protein [Brevibacillus choshinensis]|uniref:Phage protein n=1 Tax=Brevibacillus choshinensis TaxID=54911 RepID=A0ABX7FQR8_BRECH|nr:hypothetical protein [Brevibacillus choshinensis]QRG68581.1 hypothetical protein JNE38_05355 [Brevibacillus choshinensis]
MQFDKETITLLGVITAAIIALIGQIVVAIITKTNERKKALYSIVFECAYKEWEYQNNRMIETAKQKGGGTITEYPYMDYLLFYKLFIKLVDKKKVSEKDIRAFFLEQKNISKILEEERIRHGMINHR